MRSDMLDLSVLRSGVPAFDVVQTRMSSSTPVAAVVALGSNIEREQRLPQALRALRRHPQITVKAVSNVYESPAINGPDGAPDFFNAAAVIRTNLEPAELRQELRAIERQLGRVRSDDRNAPRTIDLDIVYYDDLVAEYDGWQIPAADAATAPHLALPIAEVAPDWTHPGLLVNAHDLAHSTNGTPEEARPIMATRPKTPYTHRGHTEFEPDGAGYAPELENLVRRQLIELGEDPTREGLQRTPLRVAKALDFLTSGYGTSVHDAVNGAIFDSEGSEEMVTVRDVEFYSLCEHHMLPFFGQAAVAYLPKGKIIGLSKIARIVDVFAQRLQVQERLTNQIADAIEEILDPHGVAVVLKGRHLCMMMRGVQKQESSMVTSAMRGTFRDNARTRSEFLDLIAK